MNFSLKKIFPLFLLIALLFLFWPGFALADPGWKDALKGAFGGALGGFLLGGPVGALIGAGVGALIGGVAPGIAGTIQNALMNIFVNLLFQIPLIVSGVFFFLTASLVKIVTDPGLLSTSITGPDNEAVYQTWQLVRNFANMGFVLALVAIGLGTALRIGEYQLQKTLPRLIIIALLINFTPVIVGFFIDASNIVIRYLVAEAVGKNIVEMAKLIMDASGKLMGRIFNSWMENTAIATAQTIFNVGGSLIMLLFFLLFFFRYTALMILFVFSPLAFFAYILPLTRPFWNFWWKQFISWLLVGVFGAFFLMLGAKMIGYTWDLRLEEAAEGVLGGFSDFFSVLLIALMPITFLWLGFFFTLSTTAMGASQVITTGKKAGAWVERQAREKGGEAIRKRWEESPIARQIRERMTAMATAEAPGPTEVGPRWLPRWTRRAAAGVVRRTAAPVYAGVRAAGRRFGLPAYITTGKRNVAEAKAEVEKLSIPEIVSKAKGALPPSKKIGYYQEIIGRGPGALQEAFESGLTLEEIEEVYPMAEEMREEASLRKALPMLRERELRNRLPGRPGIRRILNPAQNRRLSELYFADVFRRLTPEDMRSVSGRIFDEARRAGRRIRHRGTGTWALEYAGLIESIARNLSGEHIANLLRNVGREGTNRFENRLRQLAQEENPALYASNPKEAIKQWLIANNDRLFEYMKTRAARRLFSEDFRF